jgi:hypothetical protein
MTTQSSLPEDDLVIFLAPPFRQANAQRMKRSRLPTTVLGTLQKCMCFGYIAVIESVTTSLLLSILFNHTLSTSALERLSDCSHVDCPQFSIQTSSVGADVSHANERCEEAGNGAELIHDFGTPTIVLRIQFVSQLVEQHGPQGTFRRSHFEG